MSQPSNMSFPGAQDGSAGDAAANRMQVDHESRAGRDTPGEVDQWDRIGLVGTDGEPDPLDALRAELAMIDQQPVVDRVARFEHANVVLAAALAELDEV